MQSRSVGERRQERKKTKKAITCLREVMAASTVRFHYPAEQTVTKPRQLFEIGVLEITMPAPARQPSSRRIEISEGAETEQQPQPKSKAAGR